MEFCAIISEFNPFHSGHEYLICQAKKQTNLPVLCLMSGNFVQRGEPAITNKYARALAAINAGADMVCELPVCYALSSAEIFAYGAIKILKSLGCTKLVVGAAHTQLEDYQSAASINQKSLVSAMKNELDKGENYSKTLINITTQKLPNAADIFKDASNILALEYVRQIKRQKANIDVVLVKRTDGGYNSKKTTNNFASATIIRELLKNQKFSDANKFIPSFAHFKPADITSSNIINSVAMFTLQNMSAEKLNQFYDYSEGLPNLISNLSKTCTNFEELINQASSKRYRTARIKKLCYYPTINLTKENFKTIKSGRSVVKMLAIKKDKKKFLSEFNKNFTQVIVSRSDYDNLSRAQTLSAKLDLNASNLYNISQKEFNSDIKTGTIFC
ncbi:MAG: nucleotidyltransferase family protein [Clostridia bacterium]|nr:nucleotidyltransferase family protein [Clostridia bacterium]